MAFILNDRVKETVQLQERVRLHLVEQSQVLKLLLQVSVEDNTTYYCIFENGTA